MPGVKQPAALSRHLIVRGALQVVDGEGVGAVSIRGLAARLGVTPMAIYWHVKDKDEILDGVLDEVLGEIAPDGLDPDPLTALATMARRYRAAFQAHPRVAPVLALRGGGASPRARELAAGTLALLRAAGFAPPDAACAVMLVGEFLMGSVVNEHGGTPEALRGDGGLDGLPGADQRFEFGLACLLGGLRAMLQPAAD